MRRSLATATTLFVLALPASAPGAERAACLSASEKAQQLKNSGKLTEAREYLVACGRAECPKIIQQDCATWMSEVLAVLPSVVLAAKDRSGRDLVDVRVSIDDKRVAETLDGKPIALDPGIHTFKFETRGTSPIEEQVVINQGEKSRIYSVTFPLGEGPRPKAPPPAEREQRSAFPIVPAIIGGAGVLGAGVAVYLGLTADGDARNLRDDCAPECKQEDVDAVERRQDLARYVGIGAGAVVLVGAVWLVVHYATGAGASSAKLPLITPTANGATTILRF